MDATTSAAAADGVVEIPTSVQAMTAAGKRLFWRLDGPLEDAIQVAPSEFYEPNAAMGPCFGPDGSTHAVSREPPMQSPVSSVTGRIQCMEAGELVWREQHFHCRDLEPDEQYPRRRGHCPEDDYLLHPPIYLLECCGEKRL
ncbi:hypothetical protein OQA88_950 [Cercophora sp. LCS_1]